MTNAPAFIILSVLTLLVIVIVFAMKYLTVARRGRALEMKEKETVAAIEGLRQEIAQLTNRLNVVEKLLKDVE